MKKELMIGFLVIFIPATLVYLILKEFFSYESGVALWLTINFTLIYSVTINLFVQCFLFWKMVKSNKGIYD